MEIRFISSLTAEDEDLFAPAILRAVGAVLDELPLAYTLRIETLASHVFQHRHMLAEAQSPDSIIDSAARPELARPALNAPLNRVSD